MTQAPAPTPTPPSPSPAAHRRTATGPLGLGGFVVRAGLVLYAIVLYLFAGGFFFREWWATDLWPYKSGYTGGMSYVFISSILAAAGTSILYCAVARDLRAMVGVGIDALVITLPVAILAFSSGQKSMRAFGLVSLTTAMLGLVTAIWFRRYAWRDARPTPLLARLSFVLFILALWTFGGMMAAGSQRVLPWEVSPEVARIYGWIFLGASSYFLYAVVEPVWSNAAGQLLSFLAYDLVLIVPFIIYFRHVPPERWLNHVVYTSAIVYSAGVAIWYCFIDRRTRCFRFG